MLGAMICLFILAWAFFPEAVFIVIFAQNEIPGTLYSWCMLVVLSLLFVALGGVNGGKAKTVHVCEITSNPPRLYGKD